MIKNSRISSFSPALIILMSLFCAVLGGTALLCLSCATVKPIGLIDLFFAATSATCVTGLFTVPLQNFTIFGQSVILMLIQIGGLGLITLTLFFIYVFSNVGLATNLMASKLLDIESWKSIKDTLIFICIVTLIVETTGALLLLPIFLKDFGFLHALFLAVFHSIGSFCNAGVWLVDPTLIAGYRTNSLMLITMLTLIFIGDLGFITWNELWRMITSCKLNKLRPHLSLHSKIVIGGSLIVISVATLLFFCLEQSYSLATIDGWWNQFVYALFHGNSLRSTGFVFESPDTFHPATFLMIMLTGFVGASPFSTGSGVKITTVFIFLAMIRTAITGRHDVEINGRSIAQDQVSKSIAIVSLSVIWIITTTFILLITETSGSFAHILFESVMAYTNLGISTGFTTTLSWAGKIIIIMSMLAGRIGSLTFIIALTFTRRKRIGDFSYPEERVMLG
jgi:trk system potassium uptake protein